MKLLFALADLSCNIAWFMDLGEIDLGFDLRRRWSLPQAGRAGLGGKIPPDELRLMVLNGG
jgi:hypothetical protein